jgi:protoporphyrinogen oxidase
VWKCIIFIVYYYKQNLIVTWKQNIIYIVYKNMKFLQVILNTNVENHFDPSGIMIDGCGIYQNHSQLSVKMHYYVMFNKRVGVFYHNIKHDA